MNVLVIGGDGFIGSHFVDQATRLNHNVTVFDKFTHISSRNLEHQRGRIKFESGDFANREDLTRVLDKQDIVYHFICATNPKESWNDPFIEIDKNLRNSVKLFELAVQKKVKKIVFISSGGTIYGAQNKAVNESIMPNPKSPYGITKLAIEHFLNYYCEKYNIKADIYRLGNPFGSRQPLQKAQGVIAVWMRDIIQGSEIQIYGDSKTLRDYIYIEDVALLLTHSLNDLDSSDIYNVGSGVGTSILQLLEIFKKIIDIPFKYRIHPQRISDNSSIILDNSKIMVYFSDFEFSILEDKIKETWIEFKARMTRI
jgi:UDP-glucose 4-epimerase